MNKDEEIKRLRKENEDLKRKLNRERESSNSSAWDFHYSGHGDYEEQRRCFYGDFG